MADHDFDIEKLSGSGGTALMYAAGGGHAETCEILLNEGGANVNSRVKVSSEYLDRIEYQKKSSDEADRSSTMIEVLEVEHSDGGTALTVAAEGGHEEVVKILVDKGADIHIKADDGHNALTYSIRGGFLDIALFLLDKGADPNSFYPDESV